MIELREVDTARAMLRQTAVFTRMKQEEPDRFLRLEHLCGKTYFDIRFGLSTEMISLLIGVLRPANALGGPVCHVLCCTWLQCSFPMA